MIKYGYARVSTSQQSLTIQVDKLKGVGVESDRLFLDKKSGKNNNRDGLQSMCDRFEQLHQDEQLEDTHLYITRMDRLGRSTSHMLSLIEQFNEWGVTVHFIDDHLSTGNAHSELVMTILSAVATADRLRILERTNEGRIEAMEKGIQFGAKRSIDRERVLSLHRDGKGVSYIAKELGIKSRSSVYRILKEESE